MTFIASSDHDLPAVERLGVTARGAGLDAAQTQQAPERPFVEPPLVTLRAETVREQLDLAVDGGGVERNVDVRLAEVAVELHDLVFEDQVVSEGVVGEL